MKAVFADANYWAGVLNPKDELHGPAMSVSKKIRGNRIVTSEFVLLEVLKQLAECGARLRLVAVEALRNIQSNTDIEIVPASSELFQKACSLYGEREDKDWDAIDCSSFLIMEEREITEALTYDRHFEQMGFRALLREESQ